MMTRYAALTLCLMLPGTASAQFIRAEGAYSSHTVSARVILLDSEKGIAAASVGVVSGACSGSVAGLGEVRGRILTISPYTKVEGGEACEVELAFDATWKHVRIKGRECQAYSGAACAFEGQMATKRNER